ncbi:MAG: RNA 2',3'-cyclic phosphodiesterase [Nanoarchaeota archaeon]|nr:RNA 2',3'-cyclic phosphodiesterase [Nanoarchaeota archaeon]MBU1270441.1 RNA 2',3'-cyclic phosphodiesterase [Nanoarchaeota archaeon]MBU1604802.1 RNA 2',3'-cyclic phosphodiesterase [Nanoarchaeota archaeon]MBU2443212.1 RNA 2',3'-cyclic phosphodiesterase [Nanoarchaeota archaeon]
MRLFIAVDISEELKEEILKLEKEIQHFQKMSIVPKENLHITVKFLGEVDDQNKIINALRNVEFEAFNMTTDKTGFFPNDNFINVAWVGFDESKAMLDLQRLIDNSLSELFKKENNYIPHVTFARIKWLSPSEKRILQDLKSEGISKKTFKISSFKLVKSTLTETGPMYEALKEFKAKGL